MTRLFLLGLLLGFAGVLGAGHFYPWVAYERLPSQTSVVANGGRAETFLIRLPADRIAAIGTADASLRSIAAPALTDVEPVLLEHFKLRGADGSVIGLAARHRTATGDGTAIGWSLVIPGRGVMTMAAPLLAPTAIQTALANGGHIAGQNWAGNLEVAIVPDAGLTRTIATSAEFQGLSLSFTEQWSLTGVSDAGELRGTIRLQTVARRGT